MAKPIFNLARVCTRPVRQSIFNFALCASVTGALFVTSPVFAGSDEENLANQTGDDPTHPLGKIELLDRFTTAPGRGTAEGTTKQVDTNRNPPYERRTSTDRSCFRLDWRPRAERGWFLAAFGRLSGV
jgi:hypothetical protein